jgi:small subunit ribosomal protein S7
MPRRRDVPKRKITPDPKFHDKLVAKFTNSLMEGGKKSTAEGILYGAFDIIANRFKEDPLEVFRKALDNVKPKLEVKSRRVGGATYQVPVEVARRPCASGWQRSSSTRRRCAATP